MKIKPDHMMPALYGGLIVAAFWAIPGLNLINCFCCAGVMIGGFLSVALYERELNPATEMLTRNDCIRLGLLTAVFASVAAVAITIATTLLFGNVALEIMEKIIYRMHVDLTPEMQELLNQAEHQTITPLSAFFSLFVYIIPNSIFCVLGALLGWTALKPKQNQSM